MKEQIDSLINLQTIEKDTENFKSVLNDVSKRTEALDAKIGMFQKEIECDESELEDLQKKVPLVGIRCPTGPVAGKKK